MRRSSSGRLALTPLQPVPTYSPAISHPARFTKMTTFTIDCDHNITNDSLKEATAADIAGAEYFGSQEELAQLAVSWPSNRLNELLANTLPWSVTRALATPPASAKARVVCVSCNHVPKTWREVPVLAADSGP